MPDRPNATNMRDGVPNPEHQGATKAADRLPAGVPEPRNKAVVAGPAGVPPSRAKETPARAQRFGTKKASPKASKSAPTASMSASQPKATGGFRARRVHRVVLRVDPWSVLKLSLIFLFCFWLMMVIAAVLMWGAAVSSGTVTNLEDFIATLLSFEEFKLNGNQILRFFAMLGLIMVFVGTALSAIVAVLFNLVTSVIGGVRFTVIEEESMRRIVRE